MELQDLSDSLKQWADNMIDLHNAVQAMIAQEPRRSDEVDQLEGEITHLRAKEAQHITTRANMQSVIDTLRSQNKTLRQQVSQGHDRERVLEARIRTADELIARQQEFLGQEGKKNDASPKAPPTVKDAFAEIEKVGQTITTITEAAAKWFGNFEKKD